MRLRPWGLLLALAAVGALVFVACKQGREAPPETPPPPPPTPPGSAKPKDVPLTELAENLATALSESKFDEVAGHFDAAMSEAMPSAKLAETWIGVTAQLGDIVTKLGSAQSEHEGYQIVNVTCQFELVVMDLRFVFDKGRKVAGFFIKPPSRADVYGPRPQHPKPPYPYTEREVSYENPEDGAVFAGTLTLPPGDGPFPAVLLITGSGSQDRDETIFGHKPFLVIADRLTRAGVAVLRVDDRGNGKTKGEVKSATIELHATDAVAAIGFLASQKEIDKGRVGLIGHSEGGLLTAVVAAKIPEKVAFIVSLAGTGLPGTAINPLQVEALLRAEGTISDEGITAIVAEQRALMKLVAAGAPEKDIDAALDKALRTAIRYSPADKRPFADKYLAARMSREKAALLSPWFRSFLKLDPAVHWAKVRCPVLALGGAKDLQVPPRENLGAIDKALAAGGNDKRTLVTLEGLNHLFQPAKTGLVSEYPKIETTFDDQALGRLVAWVGEQGKKH